MSDYFNRLHWMIHNKWQEPWPTAIEEAEIPMIVSDAVPHQPCVELQPSPEYLGIVQILLRGYMLELYGSGPSAKAARHSGPFRETHGRLKPCLPPPRPYEAN